MTEDIPVKKTVKRDPNDDPVVMAAVSAAHPTSLPRMKTCFVLKNLTALLV